MARQATVSLAADTATFKKQIEDAKALLSTMGNVKINTAITDKIVEAFNKEIPKSIATVEAAIKDTTGELKKLGDQASTAFDPAAVERQLRKLQELKRELEGLKNYKAMHMDFVGPQLPPGYTPPQPAQPNPPPQPVPPKPRVLPHAEGGGIMGAASSILSGVAGTVGLGLGIGQLYSRRVEQANENMQIRQLTGGSTVSGTSALGFDSKARRARALANAEALGADLTTPQIDEGVNRGEMIERATGISAEQQAGFLGATRRSGTGDTVPGNAQKQLESTIQTAFDLGLRGSRISEYLQGIQSATEQMSQGVTLDQQSLVGFSAALMRGSDFFKADPNRAMRAQQSMDEAFKGGDRFQQAFSSRAIALAMEKNNPGSSNTMTPFGTELRREQGLFGTKLTEQERGFLEEQKGGKDLLKILTTSGPDIITAKAKDALELTKNKDIDFRVYDFKQRMGLQDTEAAIEIMRKLVDKQGNTIEGAKLGEKDIRGFKAGQLKPEERAADNMKNFDGHIVDLDTRVSDLTDILADRVTGTIVQLDKSMNNLITLLEKMTGTKIDGMGLAANAGTAAIVGGVAASGYGIAKGIKYLRGAKAAAGAASTAAGATEAIVAGEGAAAGATGVAEGAAVRGVVKGVLKTVTKVLGSAAILTELTGDTAPLTGRDAIRKEHDNNPHLKDYKFGLSESASAIPPEERASKLSQTPIEKIFPKQTAEWMKKKYPKLKTGGDYENYASALDEQVKVGENPVIAPIDTVGKKKLSKEQMLAQARGESVPGTYTEGNGEILAAFKEIFQGFPDNRPDLTQNTQALRELTQKVGGAQYGQSRLPGNATLFNGRTGK